MDKFEESFRAIYSVFSSVAWKANNIVTIPNNVDSGSINGEFIRVTVIPSRDNVVNLVSVSGIINIDIFTKAGDGPLRVAQIADKLDTFLIGKSITTANGVVQFFTSVLNNFGVDRDNQALYRHIYSIPFNFNGA